MSDADEAAPDFVVDHHPARTGSPSTRGRDSPPRPPGRARTRGTTPRGAGRRATSSSLRPGRAARGRVEALLELAPVEVARVDAQPGLDRVRHALPHQDDRRFDVLRRDAIRAGHGARQSRVEALERRGGSTRAASGRSPCRSPRRRYRSTNHADEHDAIPLELGHGVRVPRAEQAEGTFVRTRVERSGTRPSRARADDPTRSARASAPASSAERGVLSAGRGRRARSARPRARREAESSRRCVCRRTRPGRTARAPPPERSARVATLVADRLSHEHRPPPRPRAGRREQVPVTACRVRREGAPRDGRRAPDGRPRRGTARLWAAGSAPARARARTRCRTGASAPAAGRAPLRDPARPPLSPRTVARSSAVSTSARRRRVRRKSVELAERPHDGVVRLEVRPRAWPSGGADVP